MPRWIPRRVSSHESVFADAAARAWAKDHPGEEGPYNDYYIVNGYPARSTLSVAPGVQVRVHDIFGGGVDPFNIDFSQIAGHVAKDMVKDDDRLWPMPFWLP